MQEKLNELLKNSYSPYSKVKVAAILKTKDGKEFNGVNVENASFSPTICAERNAIFQAVAQGYRRGDFTSIDLTASTKGHLYPCGVCRQVMTEFFKPEALIRVWNKGDFKEFTLEELIPFGVNKESLK